jgi:hypothetical protein
MLDPTLSHGAPVTALVPGLRFVAAKGAPRLCRSALSVQPR